MKQILPIVILLIFSVSSCHQGRKDTEDITSYKYTAKVELDSKIRNKIGDWVSQGCICYGLVAVSDGNGDLRVASTIKAKVLIIHPGEIKMKALEKVDFGRTSDCNVMCISVGDTWWEKEGELFQTKEEAELYLKQLRERNTLINKL